MKKKQNKNKTTLAWQAIWIVIMNKWTVRIYIYIYIYIPCAEQFSKSAQLFRSSEYNQEKIVQASEVIHRFIATALFRMVRS